MARHEKNDINAAPTRTSPGTVGKLTTRKSLSHARKVEECVSGGVEDSLPVPHSPFPTIAFTFSSALPLWEIAFFSSAESSAKDLSNPFGMKSGS